MKSTGLSLSIVGIFSVMLVGCAKNQISESSSFDETYPLPGVGATTQTMNLGKTQTIVPDIYQYTDESKTQIVRQGRYTLVNTSPEDGQKYLLEQMVSVNVAKKKRASLTVEQGLKATLSGTGFKLCNGATFSQTMPLFSLSLPKVHYQFGPMKLREALQMLAGPAYYVTLNDVTRTICFKPREKPVEMDKKRFEIISTTTKTEIIDE